MKIYCQLNSHCSLGGGFKFVSVLLLLNCLVGCTRASQTFDCPYGKGVGCHSITEVNQMVNDGKFDKDSLEGAPHQTSPSASSDKAQATLPNDKAMVHRISEERLSVWLAPFQDEQGDFHEASVVHTVLKPGYWQLGEET